MKKVFIILGIIVFGFIVIVAGFTGYGLYEGPKLDDSSKAYIDENVPVIIRNWSKDEFLKRASPQLLQVSSENQIAETCAEFKNKLGSFQKYEGSEGNSTISFTIKNGKVITAYYVAKAMYQNGEVQIKIQLIQENGIWKILKFHIDIF